MATVFETDFRFRYVLKLDCPPFRPHPFFKGGHLQTLYGALWSQKIVAKPTIRRHIELPDGDVLSLHDDCLPLLSPVGQPVALFVHGMCGNADSPSILRIARKLQDQGIRTFRLNMRGCGDGKGLAKNPYHAGRSEDIQAVVEVIAELCPGSPIHVIGFSLGGNTVLKWLGESGSRLSGLVDLAIAVNPPVDLKTCCEALSNKLYGLYDRYFTKQLIRHVSECPHLGTLKIWNKGQKLPRRMRVFDEIVTAPQSGFRDATHYYDVCSSGQFVPEIAVPTLILTSEDDPIIPVETVHSLNLPKNVQLMVTPSGGHLGFVGRKDSDPDGWWLDWRIVDWISNPNQLLAPEPLNSGCKIAA